MSRVRRSLCAAAASLVALSPISVNAAPSPSPGVESMLAAAPTGFTELSTASLHGRFTAQEYASTADAAKQAQIIATLKREGFIDGYGNTWVNRTAQHVLVEAVVVFAGGRGARNWLTAVEAADKESSVYKHADTMSGIDPYYGAHVVDTQGNTFGDAFAFVKGNDVFEIAVVSTKDDALTQATTQTKAQYDLAPKESIPSSAWPENQADTSGHGFAYYVGYFIPVVLILALVVGVAGLVFARRRRAVPAATAAGAMPYVALQMSPDGNFWWDGQGWRDAAQEAPPHAQRSSNGALWWDGRAWRPVPQTQPPAQPPQDWRPPTS
jgi:ribosomal protein S8